MSEDNIILNDEGQKTYFTANNQEHTIDKAVTDDKGVLLPKSVEIEYRTTYPQKMFGYLWFRDACEV